MLVSLPFVLLLVGYLHSLWSHTENEDLVKDVLS